MNGNQYKTAIAQLELTQEAAAAFLKISLRTCNGYANGRPIPEGTAKLLRLMVERNIKPEKVK